LPPTSRFYGWQPGQTDRCTGRAAGASLIPLGKVEQALLCEGVSSVGNQAHGLRALQQKFVVHKRPRNKTTRKRQYTYAVKLNALCPAYIVVHEAVTRDSEEEDADIKSVDRAMAAAYSMYDHSPSATFAAKRRVFFR